MSSISPVKKSVSMDNGRIIWLDILRIISCFLVIVIHASARGMRLFEPTSSSYQACNFYCGSARCCVPIFVMISGRFLLSRDREISIKYIYMKVLRFSIVFLVWSFFYMIVPQVYSKTLFSLKDDLYVLVTGHYHMWFLYMISGLYIISPILRQLIQKKEMIYYYLILSIIIVFIGNAAITIPKLGAIIDFIITSLDLKMMAGFSTYFLLGLFLSEYSIQHFYRVLLYILGIVAYIFTISFNGVYSIITNTGGEWVFGYLQINTLFVSVAFFMFAKEFFTERRLPEHAKSLVFSVAKYCFGIYLVHVFFIEHLHCFGIPKFFIHPWIAIPINSVIVFLLSLLMSCFLSRIPIINKYML